MSSFVRRMQRAHRRKHYKPGKGAGVHYMGRGSKLGQPKMPDALKRRRRKAKVGPKTPAERLAARVKAAAIRKARVTTISPPKLPGRVNRVRDGLNRRVRTAPRPGRSVGVLANLSRNHPDYGCTPAEHAQRKAGRLAAHG